MTKRLLLIATATTALLTACTGGSGDTSSSPSPMASSGSSATTAVQRPTVTGTLATGLKAPWSVVPLSPDAALISQRNTAEILLLRDGQTSVAGTVAQALPAGEGGLLGLAMRSEDAKRVYAYYTAATDNRVVSFAFDGSTLSDETLILGGIPKGQIHDGGRIAFGPDGFLYIATGETGQPELAQDKTSLAGKILRVRPDGNPAPGNPDQGSPVWSYGHRNVQGLAWDSADRLWATEFGQSDVDELNLIEPGRNYGWPQCEGSCQIPGMTNPKATWSPTATASPSGLAIVDDTAWVAALRGEALYSVRLKGDSAEQPKGWFEQQYGRIRDVVQGPDGTLWMLTNNTDGRGQPRPDDDQLLQVAIP